MDTVKMNELIQQATNPNTAPAALEELRRLILDDTTAIETLTANKANQDEQIRQLQDTNMRLFMQSGTKADMNNQPPEKTDEEKFADFLGTIVRKDDE